MNFAKIVLPVSMQITWT